MKKLLTGDEAIARGAYEYGCHVATAYPGTPSTEVLENIANYEEISAGWAPNEKVALEVACGAAINGARTIVSMKHVGLNVAADPFFSIAYAGTNGGLLILTADEPGMHSSQNEQDNRYYGIHAKVPVIEPSDSQECKDFVGEAFEISEKYDTPILMKMTTRVCHSKGPVELKDRVEVEPKSYEKNPRKYVLVPANAKERHRVMEEERLPALKKYSEETHLNKEVIFNTDIGIIASGACYLHAREVMGENASYLKLGMPFPFPEEKVKAFAKKVKKLYIIEENEPIIENFVKQLGIPCTGKEIFSVRGEISPEIVRKALLGQESKNSYPIDVQVPPRAPGLCAGCPHRPLFYAISKLKNTVVTTDIGCYTLGVAPPLGVGETCICMGGGFGLGVGFDRSNKVFGRDKRVFGILGDSTFFHSGMTGIAEAVYSGANMVAVILDNRITAMTGHQANPGVGFDIHGNPAPQLDIETIVKALGVKESNIRVVDPYNVKQTTDAVKEAYESDEFFVIITKQPCALIKEVMKKRAGLHCEINQDKCKKCKTCMRTGCPAISMKDNVVSIDQTQCNGCTLCKQVCPFGAIEGGGTI
ncbi:MAG: indolepyruvate ferredoxin oxidoreductase subunit alpha [Tissierellia bacterium]|nr:indolepyruvate ferredoxin oxidoreductase subunit alpha [Tissierellia bacterium]